MAVSILCNGPPGSGKDYACEILDDLGYKHFSFKHQLILETAKRYKVDLKWFKSVAKHRVFKVKKFHFMDNLSPREALIHVSEKIIKPKYGPAYFGQKCADSMNTKTRYCFSDCGFLAELQPIINKIDAENVILIQLTREGCSFSGDSRRHLNGALDEEFVLGGIKTQIDPNFLIPEKINVTTYRVHNNGTKDEFRSVLESIHKKVENDRKIKNTN